MLSLLFLKILAVRLGPSCCVKGSLQRSSGHHRNRTVGWNGQHLDMTSLGEIQANFFVLRRIDGKCCTKKSKKTIHQTPQNLEVKSIKHPSIFTKFYIFSKSIEHLQVPSLPTCPFRIIGAPCDSFGCRDVAARHKVVSADTRLGDLVTIIWKGQRYVKSDWKWLIDDVATWIVWILDF